MGYTYDMRLPYFDNSTITVVELSNAGESVDIYHLFSFPDTVLILLNRTQFKCFIISKISQMINLAALKQHQTFKKHKVYNFRVLIKDLKDIETKLKELLGGY